MSRIRTISSSDLVSGMQLASDCLAADGALLLPSGTLIDDENLAKLQQSQPPSIEVFETEQQAAELERIAHLFRHAGDSIYAQILRNAVLTYRQQHNKSDAS